MTGSRDLAAYLADIEFSRRYSLGLIEATPEADWFRVPAQAPSPVAWQVVHLATAEYRLVLERACGLSPGGDSVLSADFLREFGRGMVPAHGEHHYPPVGELLETLGRVHARAVAELAARPGLDFDAPPATPHAFCKTIGECLRWCSHHEMVHAGQIGLLRRQLGHPPLW